MTMRAAVAAMSCNGWRTVVNAGPMVRGGLYIVESDNGQIFGDADFQLTGRLVNAHGL